MKSASKIACGSTEKLDEKTPDDLADGFETTANMLSVCLYPACLKGQYHGVISFSFKTVLNSSVDTLLQRNNIRQLRIFKESKCSPILWQRVQGKSLKPSARLFEVETYFHPSHGKPKDTSK